MAHTILIAGGSGPLGRAISELLLTKGYHLKFLSTSKTNINEGIYPWNPAKNEVDEGAFDGVKFIVNLSGAGVADQRWTSKRKALILESRIQSTRILAHYCKKESQKEIHLISASAIGFYPAQDLAPKTETDSPGQGFLSMVCEAWEEEARHAPVHSILRIGIVLSKEGGMLGKLKPLAKYHLLAPLGDGKQKISWIHAEDIALIVEGLCSENIKPGTYNLVAPNPVSNNEFTRSLAKASNSVCWAPPVPAFALKLMYGALTEETILSDQHIVPKALHDSGYRFKYVHLTEALNSLL